MDKTEEYADISDLADIMEQIRTTNKILLHRQSNRVFIPVRQENENDWEFVFIDRGMGVKGMAVF